MSSAQPSASPFIGGTSSERNARERILPDLRRLYAEQAEAVADRLLATARAAAAGRPPALRELDRSRAADPRWFLRQDRIGYACYVDRFCGTLSRLPEHLQHLRALGVTYLHLLPLLKMRAGDNDGGFAVSDFASVDPMFGTDADLDRAAEQLRAEGVSLCLDFVLNHVADDHPWAVAARAGDAEALARFHLVRTEAEVRALEAGLREVFPTTAPGNFTFVPEVDGWVWTTFYPFQWDLNYAEPAVLEDVVQALLALANRGVEVFRLDSIPYIWKAAGTSSMNRPEAHAVVRVLRAVCDLAAPGVVLKAEAVVATREMAAYLGGAAEGTREAHLTYQNALMVGLWESLADGNAAAIADVLDRTPNAPDGAGWVTYARCHDDIGWSLLVADHGNQARPRAERLTRFYAGEAGAFARGARFQAESGGGALATCGMLAALAGLTSAVTDAERETALSRIRLLHGLTIALPGMPVIYMGDEIGLANDPDYRSRSRFAEDERGLHRPYMDWDQARSAEGRRILADLSAMLQIRRRTPQLAVDAAAVRLSVGDPRVLAVRRGDRFRPLLALANLSPSPVSIGDGRLDAWLPGGNLLDERTWRPGAVVTLAPYDLILLQAGDDG